MKEIASLMEKKIEINNIFMKNSILSVNNELIKMRLKSYIRQLTAAYK